MQRYMPVAWAGGKAECHKDDRGEYVLHSDAQSRIAELEAENGALHGANIQLAKSCQKAHEALADSRDTAWNDAIEAAVESVLKKLYLLSIGTPEEGPFTKQDRTRDEVIEQAVESIRALRR